MDQLISTQAHHPSLRLESGQVVGFAAPPPASICSHCGKRFDDPTEHPEYEAPGDEEPPMEGLLTFEDQGVTYGGLPVTYGV